MQQSGSSYDIRKELWLLKGSLEDAHLQKVLPQFDETDTGHDLGLGEAADGPGLQ